MLANQKEVHGGEVHGRIDAREDVLQWQLRTASQTAWQTADPARGEGLTMHCLVLLLNPRGTGLEEWNAGFEDWLVQDQSRGHQCGGRSLHGNNVVEALISV